MRHSSCRRFFWTAALFLLLFALSGCGGNGSNDSGPATRSGGPAEGTPPREFHLDEAPGQQDTAVDQAGIPEIEGVSAAVPIGMAMEAMPSRMAKSAMSPGLMYAPAPPMDSFVPPPSPGDTESYDAQGENPFRLARVSPLSTFSIDVDTASYANVRRFLGMDALPPPGAVRIEEMINYFRYDYPQPQDGPFSVSVQAGPCPWKEGHRLVRIGLRARDMDKKDLPPSNLVFLIDVSGSMNAPNKLGLLKKSFKMLVDQLGRRDRVAIVVYAGADQVVLESTPGSDKKAIMAAIDTLGAGGSTHASAGIATAYELAEKAFIPGGNNRVILASDGDFNVGVTSRDQLERLIAEKRGKGIYLTVLGFGMGNYHDDAMEILADKGNGNYAYIDSLLEANKVLVKEMSGTMYALARDVKIQVEFNPARVGAYRLIGYENRVMAAEDFNDDTKDAGEIGVGHQVTALYEIIPPGAPDLPDVDDLKYQPDRRREPGGEELLTVKLRYKPLDKDDSILLETPLRDAGMGLEEMGPDFRFAAAVAAFGMVLTDSAHRGKADYALVMDLARTGRGRDVEGYRAEFMRLVEKAELIAAAQGEKAGNGPPGAPPVRPMSR